MLVVQAVNPSAADWQLHAPTVPVANYVATLWLIRDRYCLKGCAVDTARTTSAPLLAAGLTGNMG